MALKTPSDRAVERFKDRVIKAILDKKCGHCEYDEAEGILVNHCRECALAVVARVFVMCDGGKG